MISPSEDEGRDAAACDQSTIKLTWTEQFHCLSREMMSKKNV